MRRPPHGGVARPGPARPLSGYGRAVGRPCPQVLGAHVTDPVVTSGPSVLEPSLFSDPVPEPAAGVDAPASASP
jgi:hypothetical protein